MAELATVARPYARAAFDSAGEQGVLADWDALLSTAGAAVADRRVAALIGSPRVAPSELVEFILELAGQPSKDSAASRFLNLLAHNRRLLLLPEIARQYQELRAQAEGQADVEVVSAQPLSAEQEQRLSVALAQRLQRRVRLNVRVDPRLVGGAVVRHGDFVIDGSLRGRLERMAAAMSGD
jgi:F-type H+-transporting ATPase subunit delta